MLPNLASRELRTPLRMRKNKEYHVSWEGAPGIRVKAASFLGAMRAAFGPGDYQDEGAISESQRRIRWAQHSFLVTLHLDQRVSAGANREHGITALG